MNGIQTKDLKSMKYLKVLGKLSKHYDTWAPF